MTGAVHGTRDIAGSAARGSARRPKPSPREKPLEQDGWRLFEQGRWSEALQVFDQLLHLNGANEGGLQGKIACLRKLEAFDDAEALLREALRSLPASIGLLSERAWLALDQKKHDAAIDALAAVLRRSRKDESLFLARISLLRRQQRLDEAEQAIDEAAALFPQSPSLKIERGWLLLAQNRLDEAEEAFSGALEQEETNEEALQGRIASLRLRGRHAEARRQAERALQRLGERQGLLSELGWIAFEQGRYEEAERAFRKVVALIPRDPYAYVNLAWALQRQGGTDALVKAGRCCRDALAIAPELPEARGCLGMVAFKQGRIREAETQLRRSIAADPRKGHYADLGALYIQMGRYAEAEDRLREGLAVNPDDAALHLQLGNLFLQTDRLKEATSEFRQAAAFDPMHPDPPRALATALMERGEMVEAEGVLRDAIRRFGEFGRWRLHLTLCRVLTLVADQTGNPQLLAEALKEANEASRLQPQDADPRFHAGIVRFKLGDYRGALRAFERSREADPRRVDAEINARRVRALIQEEKRRSGASRLAGLSVGTVVLAQLGAIWWLRWLGGAGEHALVTSTMITVLTPVCLGLLVVAVVLPQLSKLKLTGLEAELSEPKPKEALESGPKGEIGFGNASRAIGLTP